MALPYRVELLNAAHHRAAFSCGAAELDRYLREQAGQEARRDVARTFVLCESGSLDVLGYYSLSAVSIEYGDLPPSVSRRLPRYPTLPAFLLGRLAVDARRQGRGIGKLLLMSALQRSLAASRESVAALAVVVDARDEAAARFYERYGFISFPEHRLRLFIPMASVAAMLAPPDPPAP